MNLPTTGGLTMSIPAVEAAAPRLQPVLKFATLTVAAALVAVGSQTLAGFTEDNRSELNGLTGSLKELKVQSIELEKANDLSAVGNSERRSIILELDAALNSTEGFLQ